MESDKKLDYDSDIIICDDIPDIILVPSSPDEPKKVKTKKTKRKVKRGINYNNNTETLLITQNFQVNKTKLKCVIINTLNTVCKERSASIVRHEKNVCKKEAYYHRILPICRRKKCLDATNYILSSGCRSTKEKKYKKEANAKAESLSPVSSVALTEIFPGNNMSYEEVSDEDLSSTSDDELETLIKRTKLRENKIDHSYSAPQHASTPISTFQDIASPYSIEMEKSIHSDTTMMLNPMSSEAYSPTASMDYIEMDNLERSKTKADYLKNNLFYIDVPYSPTMIPDLIKEDNMDYTSIGNVKNSRKDDIPYSPSYTPESIELENIDYESIMNRRNTHNDISTPYSPTLTPDFIENFDSTPIRSSTPYTPFYGTRFDKSGEL